MCNGVEREYMGRVRSTSSLVAEEPSCTGTLLVLDLNKGWGDTQSTASQPNKEKKQMEVGKKISKPMLRFRFLM